MTTLEGNVIVRMQDVVKTYDTGEVPFVALDRVNLEIRQGEFLGITGRSGAGKTTLLNMISGVSELTSGAIYFHWSGQGAPGEAVPIHALDEDALARWRGEHLGIIYQSFELMPTLSLLDNVMLPLDFLGSYQPLPSRQRALELLDLVEIADHAHKIPAHISGGQKQRVAIARALVNDPHVILADEPTGNLDSRTSDEIMQLLSDLNRSGKTIIMVTHENDIAAWARRVVRMRDGHVESDVRNEPAAAALPASSPAIQPAARVMPT